MSLYNPYIWYFRTYASHHAVGSAAPPFHDRRLLLHLLLMRVWMVPLVFGTENWTSIFPRNKLKYGLIWPRHTFPPSFQEIQVAFLNAAANCGKWQRFSEVLLSPCGYISHRCMTVSHAMPSEGSKVMYIHCLALHLLRFLWNSLNPFTIVCMVVVERHQLFCDLALRSVIFGLFDTSFMKFGTKWWAKLCLQRLRCSFYTKHDNLTNYQFTCLLCTVSKQFNWDIL